MRIALGFAKRAAVWLAALYLAVISGFAASAWWRLPDLKSWHQITLEGEFRADAAGAATSFSAYMERENALFAELKRTLAAPTSARDAGPFGRYGNRSVVAELAQTGAGNRTTVRVHPQSQGAVLLLHGLTDGPYSLGALGERFYQNQISVVSVRLPGHGTLPAELIGVRWEDWYAVVKLAAAEAARLSPRQPLYIVGYSTGAPLALLYALDALEDPALEDPALKAPAEMFLLSPALGVSKLGFVSLIAAQLAFIPGLEKARWLDVYPEADPYKYASFPINGGRQIWRLTRSLNQRLANAKDSGGLDNLPRLTVFQSLVDATVAPRATLAFLNALPARKSGSAHEFVLFDLNRHERLSALINPIYRAQADEMADAGPFLFDTALISNRDASSADVAEYARSAGARSTQTIALPLSWPADLLSLSHVALPFKVDDPLYGLTPAIKEGQFTLGGPAPRGENGALALPLGHLARIRSNPFFEVIGKRVDRAIGSPSAAIPPAKINPPNP